MTALHWAAHWDDLETVRLLLRAGANAKVANRYGVTPLHEACTVSNVAMIEALLKAGADPNAVVRRRRNAADDRRADGQRGRREDAAHLWRERERDEAWRGQTALMWAAAENHAAVVKLLIELHADVNARSVHYEFAKLTGGNGGIIHDRSEGGLTALLFAARQGAIESADVLIEAGADMNLKEPQYGFTPMQTAIFNGHYDLAARLIEKGADVNDGSLYTAIEMRNLATYSNRPNPPDTDKRLNSLDLVTLLLARGADPNEAYWKKIPPRQAQGDIAVPIGATPLYRATRSMDLAAIRLLVEKGADPEMAITDNSTPLMMASGLGARPRGGEEDVDREGRPRRSARRDQALRGRRRRCQRDQRSGKYRLALRGANRSDSDHRVPRRQRREARRRELSEEDPARSRQGGVCRAHPQTDRRPRDFPVASASGAPAVPMADTCTRSRALSNSFFVEPGLLFGLPDDGEGLDRRFCDGIQHPAAACSPALLNASIMLAPE